MIKFSAAILTFLLVILGLAESSLATKLLRFPDIHADQIVFYYAGDIWRVSSEGGDAVRVTAHPGLEIFPKFSPDGTQIAFTGQYDGDEQVYVVPTVGGVPRQLTFYPAKGPLPDRWGYDNQVYGWSPDGKSVLFRSMRQGWTLTDTRLYLASLSGGLPQQLPMSISGAGDLSPDGESVVFSPLTRDFRTWKRYQGGWAQDLYTFDLSTHQTKQITSNARTDRDPMWMGDRIYFASDRTGTLNLFYYDTQTGATEQVTRYDQYDVRWPSMGGDQIVFELGGELHILDTPSGGVRRIAVNVPTDAVAARQKRVKASVSDYSLSPEGKRLVVNARGELLTVPAEKGVIRNLTHSSNAHEKHGAWSPNGQQIAYVSDRTGEEELYLIDQLGKGPPQLLTKDGKSMRYRPNWSPDGKLIAISNKDGELSVIDVATKNVTLVANEMRGHVTDDRWSPQGGHLAFSMSGENTMSSIYIWSVADSTLRQVTGDLFNETEPVWDPNGKYLYYLSEREYAPQIGNTEWNYVRNRQTGIFALALRKDVANPYPPESDEVDGDEKDDDDQDDDDQDEDDQEGDDQDDDDQEGDDEQKSGDNSEKVTEEDQAGNDDKEDADTAPIQIDFEGLGQRVARVPVSAANLEGLEAIEEHLLYVSSGPFYYGRDADVTTDLMIFSHEDREEEVLVEDIMGYTLSPDGTKVAVRDESGIRIMDPTEGPDDASTVDTSVMLTIAPQEEWRQIFHEVWRRFRDFFYVDNMHGYDWQALREKYEPLLDHVAHRSDLNYVIGEMIGELNVGHAYKAGGDFEQPTRQNVALLGAVFELDKASDRYRFAKIFPGDNAEAEYQAPLTEVGVDVKVGDYLLAIDGDPLTGADNPYQSLRYKAEHPVLLRVNSTPVEEGAREVTVNPIDDESKLVYLDWVVGNYEKVDQATEGQVGYLHLPDMGADGIREFNKWFYGQLRKKGLIIDVRSNGGGNVSQMVIDRLRRTLLATGFARTNDLPSTYPAVVFHGHLVCLLDEDSASDGDIFPAMFREAKLGPLIGKRSWGGVIGITNRGTLLDGGSVFVPEFGFLSAAGEWIIEGYGVEPDIEVENDPTSLLEGRDPQLERGIAEITKMIRDNPKQLPRRPAPPVKTK